MMFLSFLVHKQAANMASALGIHPEYANVYLLTGRVSTRIEHIFLIYAPMDLAIRHRIHTLQTCFKEPIYATARHC